MAQPAPSPNPGDLHEDQIVELLRTGAHASLLIQYFGESEYRELSELARLAAVRRDSHAPPVLILPGVMGSRLAVMHGDAPHLLWLHPHSIGGGALANLKLPGESLISAVGVMLPGYLKLKLWLEIEGFRPLFHPFDWRLDIERSAEQLLDAIEALNGDVALIAHSMGGLVARAALGDARGRRISKLIQLGVPNEGSFAPVQALRGVYPTVRKLACLDHHHSAEQLAREVFHSFAGLYQMLPGAGCGADLFDPAQWPQDDLRPDAQLLARARAVRMRLPAPDERCRVIVGVQQETIASAERTSAGFAYETRTCGDGTVPMQCAHWPGAAHWYVREMHGALTQNRAVLAAVADLLKQGDTARLDRRAPEASLKTIRRTTDAELRTRAAGKLRWESLSADGRRRILEPLITAEFEPSAV